MGCDESDYLNLGFSLINKVLIYSKLIYWLLHFKIYRLKPIYPYTWINKRLWWLALHFLILYPKCGQTGFFQEIIVCANAWENRLEHLSSLWTIYQQKEDCAKNWLQQARAILQENTDDPEASIKRHNTFFRKQNNKILEECLKAGQDILAVLKNQIRLKFREAWMTWKLDGRYTFLLYRQTKANKGYTCFMTLNLQFNLTVSIIVCGVEINQKYTLMKKISSTIRWSWSLTFW